MVFYSLCIIVILDVILQSEIEKRDADIEDLKQKYSSETKLRIKVEKKRDNLAKQLVSRRITIILFCHDDNTDLRTENHWRRALPTQTTGAVNNNNPVKETGKGS